MPQFPKGPCAYMVYSAPVLALTFLEFVMKRNMTERAPQLVIFHSRSGHADDCAADTDDKGGRDSLIMAEQENC